MGGWVGVGRPSATRLSNRCSAYARPVSPVAPPDYFPLHRLASSSGFCIFPAFSPDSRGVPLFFQARSRGFGCAASPKWRGCAAFSSNCWGWASFYSNLWGCAAFSSSSSGCAAFSSKPSGFVTFSFSSWRYDAFFPDPPGFAAFSSLRRILFPLMVLHRVFFFHLPTLRCVFFLSHGVAPRFSSNPLGCAVFYSR